MMKRIAVSLLFVLAFTPSLFSQKQLGMFEFLTNTTVRIEASDVNNIKNGTGFFFLFETNNGNLPSIVTNKHLLENAVNITVFFLEATANGLPAYGKTQHITLKRSDIVIFDHPDATVDLAIIPVASILNYLTRQKIAISYRTLSQSIIPKDTVVNSLRPIEDVYMIGYPAVLQKELNGTPLVKKGITATPFYLDHNKRKEFLTDITGYNGCGGSPVIIYQTNNNDRYDERMDGQRMMLAGIATATYTKDFAERIYFDEITKGANEPVSIIIKSQRLLDFIPVLNNLKK